MAQRILTINAGSSSIKFALFDGAERRLSGTLDRMGSPDGKLSLTQPSGKKTATPIATSSRVEAIDAFMDWLTQQKELTAFEGVGHRIVHGGPNYRQHAQVDAKMLTELRRISPYAPEHLPAEIELIERFTQRFPKIAQVACFDTAFHANMPRVAKWLPLPRRYDAQGIQRYGFHGLSYAYLLERLAQVAGDETAHGRVILAHLGNGASLAAVRDGKSMDTTMGFTPTAGLVMSTRTGDLDPGLVSYLAHAENMSADQFHELVNKHSGLIGISETSSDMRDLQTLAETDLRAAEAIELFCYSARRWIGSLAAVLGGVDTLVFSGGIGENAAVIRSQICAGLQFLGLHLDEVRNRHCNPDAAPLVSTQDSPAAIRVIHTDEEAMIAQYAQQVLGNG